MRRKRSASERESIEKSDRTRPRIAHANEPPIQSTSCVPSNQSPIAPAAKAARRNCPIRSQSREKKCPLAESSENRRDLKFHAFPHRPFTKIDARPGGENNRVPKKRREWKSTSAGRTLPRERGRRAHHEKTRVRDRARWRHLVRNPNAVRFTIDCSSACAVKWHSPPNDRATVDILLAPDVRIRTGTPLFSCSDASPRLRGAA